MNVRIDVRRLRHGGLKRDLGHRVAPAYMADRARRHERHVRARDGVIDLAERLLADGPPVVRGGPFAGLRYPGDRLADIDVPVAKLLGVYEREIGWAFENALQRDTHTFVDVGCADGYYAVGMAFAAPGLTTHAFDIARSARELCAQVAALNGVADRVKVKGRFSTASLAGLDMDGALMLCDIEGAEGALFDETLLARLRHTFVVIEVHEYTSPGLCARLCDAFYVSHAHQKVEQAKQLRNEQPPSEQPRNEQPPNDFTDLPLTPREVAIALGENRPADLHWLVFDPRDR